MLIVKQVALLIIKLSACFLAVSLIRMKLRLLILCRLETKNCHGIELQDGSQEPVGTDLYKLFETGDDKLCQASCCDTHSKDYLHPSYLTANLS